MANVSLNRSPGVRDHLPATDPFDGWEEFNFPTDEDEVPTFTNLSGEYATEEDIIHALEMFEVP